MEMLNPICFPCGREMIVKKNGVSLLVRDAASQDPLYLVHGDLFVCPRCTRFVVAQLGTEPTATRANLGTLHAHIKEAEDCKTLFSIEV